MPRSIDPGLDKSPLIKYENYKYFIYCVRFNKHECSCMDSKHENSIYWEYGTNSVDFYDDDDDDDDDDNF